MENSFSRDQGSGRGGSGSNASNGWDASGGNGSDGERQMQHRLLAHHSPPAVQLGS